MEAEEKSISVNDLFKQLNTILKRDIEKAFANETDIEVGDKFSEKDKTSDTQISIQTFSFASNKFPVIFQPQDVNFTDDKKITAIKGDLEDSSSIFKIETDNSEEATKAPEKVFKSSTEKNESTSTTTTSKSIDISTKSSATLKDEKLVEEASKLPILSTGV